MNWELYRKHLLLIVGLCIEFFILYYRSSNLLQHWCKIQLRKYSLVEHCQAGIFCGNMLPSCGTNNCRAFISFFMNHSGALIKQEMDMMPNGKGCNRRHQSCSIQWETKYLSIKLHIASPIRKLSLWDKINKAHWKCLCMIPYGVRKTFLYWIISRGKVYITSRLYHTESINTKKMLFCECMEGK